MAPTEKAKRLRKGAAKGSRVDQFEFGLLYYSGTEGVKRDVATAAEWIQKAAAQGLVRAQTNLGSLYMGGEGVERDKEQAVVWWKKAASQDPGSCEEKGQRKSIMFAQRNLAQAYNNGGEGVHTSALCSSAFSNWFLPS
jgi:TPR repeat protein